MGINTTRTAHGNLRDLIQLGRFSCVVGQNSRPRNLSIDEKQKVQGEAEIRQQSVSNWKKRRKDMQDHGLKHRVAQTTA